MMKTSSIRRIKSPATPRRCGASARNPELRLFLRRRGPTSSRIPRVRRSSAVFFFYLTIKFSPRLKSFLHQADEFFFFSQIRRFSLCSLLVCHPRRGRHIRIRFKSVVLQLQCFGNNKSGTGDYVSTRNFFTRLLTISELL